MRRHLVAGGLAVGALLMLSSCSSTPTQTDQLDESDVTTAFVEFAIRYRAEAAEAGASDEQLTIIDSAIENGEITLEQIQLALSNLGNCLDEGGLRLTHVEFVENEGFMELDYRIEYGTLDTADDEAEFAHMNACEATHFRWVDMLYQSQPTAVEASDAAFLKAMPTLIDCLQAGGVPVEDDFLPDEVQGVMLRWLVEHEPATKEDGSVDMTDPMAIQHVVVIDCMQDSGIDGF